MYEKKKEIEQKTYDYFNGGFNCAESISKAIIEEFSKEKSVEIPKIASGFGGGVGHSKDDICGTLAGGIMALGFLYGRMNQGENIQKLMKITAEFRTEFINKFGSSNCKILLDKFGVQEKSDKCKKITAEAAGLLADLIAKNN